MLLWCVLYKNSKDKVSDETKCPRQIIFLNVQLVRFLSIKNESLGIYSTHIEFVLHLDLVFMFLLCAEI